MSELLGKERTPKEIEAGLDGIGALVNLHHAITSERCPRHLAVGMATSAVSSLQFRCRALEAERDEKAGVAEVYYNTMTSYENDNRELRVRLREVEAENRDLKYVVDVGTNFDPGTALARLHKIYEEAATDFRLRAIEAVRALDCNAGDIQSAAVYQLQSLPATSEEVGHDAAEANS